LNHALTPRGRQVRLLRSYERLDGSRLAGPVKRGEAIAAKLGLELEEAREQLNPAQREEVQYFGRENVRQ
jgi:hypothetical protein